MLSAVPIPKIEYLVSPKSPVPCIAFPLRIGYTIIAPGNQAKGRKECEHGMMKVRRKV